MKAMKIGSVTLAACAALAACGGSSSSGPSGTVPAAALQTRMLTVADVGSPWQLGHAVTALDFGDATKLPCADTALNPTIIARLTPVAGVQFEPVDGSPKHLIEFALTGEAGRLATDLQLYAEGFELCNQKVGSDAETATLDIK